MASSVSISARRGGGRARRRHRSAARAAGCAPERDQHLDAPQEVEGGPACGAVDGVGVTVADVPMRVEGRRARPAAGRRAARARPGGAARRSPGRPAAAAPWRAAGRPGLPGRRRAAAADRRAGGEGVEHAALVGVTSASTWGSAEDAPAPRTRPRPPGKRGTTSRAAGTSDIASSAPRPARGRAAPSSAAADSGVDTPGRAAGPPRRAGRALVGVGDDERLHHGEGERVEVVAGPVHRRPDARAGGEHGQVRGRRHGQVGRSRSSAASVSSSWARSQSTSGVDISSTVVCAPMRHRRITVPLPPPVLRHWIPSG